MAPIFQIHNVRNTGRTDNSGDDTLYVVHMTDEVSGRETVRFSVARRSESRARTSCAT